MLCVTLDKDLSYKEHTSDQLKKAYAKASVWCNDKTLQSIYITSSRIPFVGIGTGQRNRLEDGNCYILRTLIGHNKSMSYDELLTTASMKSLYCKRSH